VDNLSGIEPSIWSSVVRSLLFPLSERNINTQRLLHSCGILAEDLEHPHTPIPLSKYLLFMESAAREAEDPLLGIRLGQACGPEILGALGFLFLSSQTIYEALNNLSRYETLLQDVTHMTLRREGSELWFSYELFGVEAAEGRQDIEFSLSFTNRMIRLFGGGQVQVSAIHFRHDPSTPILRYEKLLGTRCSFGEESNTIRIPERCTNISGKLFDPHLFQILKDYLDVDLERKMRLSSFAEQLERIVYDGHIKPPITAQKMASQLGISTATLNRRLRAEGKAFKEVVDAIHFAMARRFLTDSSLSVTQISEAVGFSSVASFTRAFCRWTHGTSPSQFRTASSQRAAN